MVRAEDSGESAETVVVLFTLAYPYGNGEPFLHAEVAELSRQFDRVLIVPSSVTAFARPPRAVPSNVTVLGTARASVPRAVARQVVLHLPQTVGALVHALRARTDLRGKLQEVRFRIAVHVRVNTVRRRVRAFLRDRSRVVFYAYWLDLPAAIAIDVRRTLAFGRGNIIARAHGFDVYAERRISNYLPMRDDVLRSVTRIFSVSLAGCIYMRRRWPDHADKMSIAHLGTAPAENAGNAEQSVGTLVSCAFIVPLKRLELVIDSVAELQSRGHDVRWKHIGPTDSPYATDLKRYAAGALPEGTFEFVGELDNGGVRNWYAHNPASAFINVSESEGVPVSIMEALAQGLPILATDVGGNAETIDTSLGMFDGLLPADPTARQIADRVEGLLQSDPAAYRRYVDASRENWKRAWSSEANYRVFVSELLADAQTREGRGADVD